MTAFLEDLAKIELRELDFFLFELPENSKGDREKLENHYLLNSVKNKLFFGFRYSSSIPLRIRKLSFNSFKSHFPDGEII